jgi:hypothetical protein
LRQDSASNELGRDRTADVQTVVIAVGHVAERHAIEREAETVLIEAAHRDAGRPFVRTVRVGGLEVDAGKSLDRLQRARARRQVFDLLCSDRLRLPRFTATQDDHFFQWIGCIAVSLLCLCRGARQNGADCENQSL